MQYYYAAKAVLYLRRCNDLQNHSYDKQELEVFPDSAVVGDN